MLSHFLSILFKNQIEEKTMKNLKRKILKRNSMWVATKSIAKKRELEVFLAEENSKSLPQRLSNDFGIALLPGERVSK